MQCQHRYRDRADIHVTRDALLALLGRAHRLLGCTDDRRWANPWGKTCADYETPLPAAKRFDGARAAGGWCAAGSLKPEAHWAGGAQFGWPERHCCACGRNASSTL